MHEFIAPCRVYQYPFELVIAVTFYFLFNIQAYERRFPASPLIPEMVDSEILEETVSEDQSEVQVKRKMTVSVKIPFLLRKFVGTDRLYFIQTNQLNRRTRTMTITAINESFSNRANIKETCHYKVHPDNSNWTLFEQQVKVQIFNLFGVEKLAEKFGMKTYAASIENAKEVIPVFIEKLKEEGVTYVPPFVDVNSESSQTLHVNNTRSTDMTNENNLETIIDAQIIQIKNHLKNRFADDSQRMPCDLTIRRFIVGAEYKYEQVLSNILKYLKFREVNKIDGLTGQELVPKALAQYYYGDWIGEDVLGRPLYFIRLGSMDMKGLYQCLGPELMFLKALKTFEEGISMNKATNKWSLLLDLENLTLRHIWRPLLRLLLKIAEVAEKFYPETVGFLVIINPPRVFGLIWSFVNTMVPEKTKKCISILFKESDNSIFLQKLSKFVTVDNLPVYLGGEKQSRTIETDKQHQYMEIATDTLIPANLKKILEKRAVSNSRDSVNSLKSEQQQNKSTVFYIEDEEKKEEDRDVFKFSTTSLNNLTNINNYGYKQAILSRTAKDKCHSVQVAVPAGEVNSLLTWDFDVLEGEVEFSVHFSFIELGKYYNEAKNVKDDNGSLLVNGGAYCKKMSVQGSFKCEQAGFYYLVWSRPSAEQDSVNNNLDVYVLYYHEILPQQQYQNSLVSLASSISPDMDSVESFAIDHCVISSRLED